MLTELCQELRNWFCTDADKHVGNYVISGGVITPSVGLQDNQYFRIVGSVFNDGVHKYNDVTEQLKDESFHGAIWCMKIPEAILELDRRITTFNESSAGQDSPFTSESFGGYSYTRGTRANGSGITWKETFSGELNRWRKI